MTVAASRAAADIVAAHVTAVMVATFEGVEGLGTLIEGRRANAVVIGPGLEPDERTWGLVKAVLARDVAAVLDAGALTAFAGHLDALCGLVRERGFPTILTPHGGEFERLFGDMGVGEAATRTGATVLRKGPATRIAGEGAESESRHGPPWLATAGTGDVLAGLVAGLLAQGTGAVHAAQAAVWLHGEAARRLGPGMTADDMDAGLRPVIGEVVLARMAASRRAGQERAG